MALSGSVTTTSSHGRSVTLNWTANQNISTNTSTISWELIGSGTASGYVTVNELRIIINGTQVYYRSPNDDSINCYIGTKVASGTTDIKHDDNGSKSFSISVEVGIYSWSINCSGNGSFTLNTIPRSAEIIEAKNIELGNNCEIKWKPAAASFTYRLKFTLGTWSYITYTISPNTTSEYVYSDYAIPLSVAYQLPNTTVGTVTAYLYTYNNDSQIGVTNKTFSVTVPLSIIPTINSLSVEIVNDNSIINNWGIAIAGYSKVKILATASGIYGSKISNFSIDGGYTTSISNETLSYIGNIVSSSGEQFFEIVAKDTRGRASLKSTSDAIYFYSYSKPTISSFSAKRSQDNSRKIIVNAIWKYSEINGKNSSTAILYYKKKSSNSWIEYGQIENNSNFTLEVDFEETSSYNFRLIVRDSLENMVQEEIFISTIDVSLDFRAGGKGIGIGKICESDNLEISMDAIFLGNIYIRQNNIDISLSDYIKNIINTNLN
mgnify:CR=1 FL=1